MAGLSRPLPPPHLLSIQRPWQPDPVSSSSSTPPIQAPAAAAVVRLLPSDDNPPRPKAVKSISAVKTISFSGCITCRLRKKKCDEGTPACEACKRLNVECLGYSKKRPPFLRDKDLSAQARTDLTNFLSRTGKVSNRGKNSAKSKAAASSAPLNEGSTFGFDAYRKMWEENEQGDVKGGEGRTSKKPKPPTLRSTASSSTSSTMASVREQQPVSPPDSEVVLSASPETSASTGYFSSRNTSIVSASCISNLGWASAEASPSWPDQSQFAVSYPISSSSSYQPQSYPRPPPHVQLPMGADVQYGPFTSPPWQQVALAMDEPDSIPRPLDSPLSRLNLPKEQYELIQIYVAHIDVYASLTVSDQELRQHNKLHHQLDQSDARCACMDEALTGNVITYKALQDPAFVNAASAMASKFRDLKLLCANDQASSTPTGLAGLDPTRRSSNLSQTHDKTDAYRHKSYSALVKNLNTGYSDLITALFTCQRLIWTNVYEGGVNGWKQPLETMRWCLQNLFQGITNRGTIALDVQSIDPRILFLLRRVVTIDLAACISSESTTPLYSFYRTLLTHPQFHLSTGSDLLSHVSSSNIICQIFLEGATLKGWKRASALTYNPNELAARAVPIQQLIDTLLGGSFEESLRRYSSDFDYFASPFRTMNFLCCQICAQAGQIYLSSTLYGNDPTHPAIASAVSAIIDLVAILPTQLCLPAIVFPLFLASVYSLPADRTWFVEIMSSRVLGPESDYLGNVGPMRVLRDEVWRAQDVWEVRGRQMGMERVDWQLVMRQLRMEILLM